MCLTHNYFMQFRQTRPGAAASAVWRGKGAAGPGTGRCPEVHARRGAGGARPLTRYGASEGEAGVGQRGAAVGAGRSTSVCRPSITASVAAAAATSSTGTEKRAPPPPSRPPPVHTRVPLASASGE